MYWLKQVNNTDSDLTLRFGGKELQYRRNESLLKMMEAEGIVKQVFPTHGRLLCILSDWNGILQYLITFASYR